MFCLLNSKFTCFVYLALNLSWSICLTSTQIFRVLNLNTIPLFYALVFAPISLSLSLFPSLSHFCLLWFRNAPPKFSIKCRWFCKWLSSKKTNFKLIVSLLLVKLLRIDNSNMALRRTGQMTSYISYYAILQQDSSNLSPIIST